MTLSTMHGDQHVAGQGPESIGAPCGSDVVNRVPRDHCHGLGVFLATVLALGLRRAKREAGQRRDADPEQLLGEWVLQVPTPDTAFEMNDGDTQGSGGFRPSNR